MSCGHTGSRTVSSYNSGYTHHSDPAALVILPAAQREERMYCVVLCSVLLVGEVSYVRLHLHEDGDARSAGRRLGAIPTPWLLTPEPLRCTVQPPRIFI